MHVAALLGAALALPHVAATIFTPQWSSCLGAYQPVAQPQNELQVQNVLATIVPGSQAARQNLVGDNDDVLRIDVLGVVSSNLVGYNDTSGKLATLFTKTTEAGIMQYTSMSYLCNSLWPANSSAPRDNVNNYCTLGVGFPAGLYGLNVSVPLYNVHALTTLHTEIHVVDASDPALSILCLDISLVPYEQDSWPYKVFLWVPAAIAIAYLIVTWAARFAAGWVIGLDRSDQAQREAHMLKWGTMLISGLSGERLGASAALLRFVTPSLRDIIHHIQFVTMLGMITVRWPGFFYAIVTQSAWANLVWNVSIVSNDHPSVYPANWSAPDQMKSAVVDPQHALYLNESASPRALDLDSTPDGMLSWARMVGLRPQDLFGTCLTLFLMLAAVIVVFSLLMWLIHWLTEAFGPERTKRVTTRSKHVPRHSSGALSATTMGSKEWNQSADFTTQPVGVPLRQAAQAIPTVPSRWHRTRKRFMPRGEAGAFHFSALYGNLLRLIITFHFPVTAFSVYQLTLKEASIVSKVFAALAFVFISVLIPTFIMFKISRTPTGKLYDAARTLLALGTVYNVYEPEKQLYRTLPLFGSLASGIVIGAGQSSGLAQTIVLVVVELASFITTTFWSPWGQGASMGAYVFFVSVVRIASIVLTMVMSKEVNAGGTPGQWITYVILLIQAIVFIFLLLMVLTKIVEGLIRLFGRSPFDESNHPIDGGIFAAIMDLDCLNGVRGGKAAARRRRKRDSRLLQQNVSVAGSLTTQMMLDRHSQGVERMSYPLLDSDHGHGGGGLRGSYFPVSNPGISPVNEFGGRRSVSDQGSMLTISDENRLTEPWRPMNYYGDAQPLASPSAGTTPLGSPRLSGGYYSGPAPSIRVTKSDDQHYMPRHSRAYSSSAIMEELSSPNVQPTASPPMRSSSTSPGISPAVMPGPVYPPTAGARADRAGGRPPPLTIPRRRSLNNISIEAEEQSRQNKRRSWSSGNWFSKSNSGVNVAEDSGSDDEPGPPRTRRRARPAARGDVEAAYDPPPPSRGWKALFSRKGRAMDEQERTENSVRKAVAMNVSGALLAGVDAPPPPPGPSTFKVQRKLMAPPRPPRPDSGEINSSSLLAAPPRSFKVRRKGEGPERLPTPAGSSMSHLIKEEDEELIASGPPSSYHDARQQPLQHSATSLGSSDPLHNGGARRLSQGPSPAATPVPGVTERPPRPVSQDSLGYSAAMFVPLNDRS
ncbi:hypothetical protein CC85DRAFT_287777 [Cutaneotrichosporon oleaginosum]|uniref:TRP C-terminal domain-containing protein n=1 Tax=Cutaneotrichosporon oleaginosum TaxID=879819 RepID=A0A0J0XGK1_9TREE|nr:uncharacterized protein CC85DRAFT_287777 [Cutaneotrichosporon oleaginosum]KLT40152.1 hypothetical protein CC85DRAFT_287777 [Cutaneotrichosporon oleaginosum]TXT06883.1 hypothetical protein COLE_06214 [Cutaneotrichosporon oleaginosum]